MVIRPDILMQLSHFAPHSIISSIRPTYLIVVENLLVLHLTNRNFLSGTLLFSQISTSAESELCYTTYSIHRK